ncbi:hypothetical protein C8R43DRAFT_1194365 [Mycena crocata]|nr:hypothetical protein C8R43DRAFT_1194365 [Mycena crocata]
MYGNRDKPSFAQSLAVAILDTAAICGLGLAAIVCMPCLGASCYYQRWESREPRLPPLRKKRIDIHRRRPVEQSQSCHFLRLPPELRQDIYMQLLAGYIIRLRASKGTVEPRVQYYVQSWCYKSANFPGEEALQLAEYRKEAPPVPEEKYRLRCYIFRFATYEFEAVFLAAIGRYALPDIGNIHLCHCPDFISEYGPSWEGIFLLLHQMRLEHLTLEFRFYEYARWTPTGLPKSIDYRFCRELLRIKNLRSFDIRWNWEERVSTWWGEPSLSARQRGAMENLQKEFRKRMIGGG